MKTEFEILRHSTAHLLAAAIKQLYPETKLGIGPVIENGFYYDFLFKKPVSSDDFHQIEEQMRKLQKKNLSFTKIEKTLTEAKVLVKELDEPLKLELIEDIEATGTTKVSFYQTGDFIDLCTGPHVKNTKEIGAYKLLSLAASYWKGDEKKQSLQRIYGTAWESEDQLNEHLEQLAQAKETDHRKLGKELGLFVFSDLIGSGLPLLTAKGTTIRRVLERFIVDLELKQGYQHVWTPPLAKVDLYRLSGHYPYFKDSMYPPMKVETDELILRPMTCPHHFMLFKSQPHSYRELPLKMAEISPMFRYEKSGELSGLMRARMFTLSDAHIFTTPKGAKEQIAQALELIDTANSALGLSKGRDYRYRLSLGDRGDIKKYFNDSVAWEQAEQILREVLKERKEDFYEASGEAAFYGPKIDVQMKNALGKEETAFTVQYDFVMPKKFELTYIDEDNKEKELVVIHRSSIGAFERVIAFLLEHYSGNLPSWLSPVQVAIVPIADRHLAYAERVREQLMAESVRVEVNGKSEPMQAKIRDAQLQKIPFVIIMGDREQAQQQISVRSREGNQLEISTLDDLIKFIKSETPD